MHEHHEQASSGRRGSSVLVGRSFDPEVRWVNLVSVLNLCNTKRSQRTASFLFHLSKNVSSTLSSSLKRVLSGLEEPHICSRPCHPAPLQIQDVSTFDRRELCPTGRNSYKVASNPSLLISPAFFGEIYCQIHL